MKMFGLFRKKKEVADTFAEAAGGSWGDAPDVIPGDGGQYADYVGETLQRAHAYALEHEIPIGQEFEFTLEDIPVGISGPHEIVFGLMMRAEEFGLSPGLMINESATFTRLR